jgi:hypothetical protein
MRCPDEIAEIVVPMLKYGLLRVRTAAWQGKTDLCVFESDHIHNLPDLLANFTPDKLAYYWNAERPANVGHIGVEQSAGWEEHWNQLGEQVAQLHSVASHS